MGNPTRSLPTTSLLWWLPRVSFRISSVMALMNINHLRATTSLEAGLVRLLSGHNNSTSWFWKQSSSRAQSKRRPCRPWKKAILLKFDLYQNKEVAPIKGRGRGAESPLSLQKHKLHQSIFDQKLLMNQNSFPKMMSLQLMMPDLERRRLQP